MSPDSSPVCPLQRTNLAPAASGATIPACFRAAPTGGVFFTVAEEAREKLEHGIWATAWMPSPLAVEIATMWIENETAWQTSERKRQEIEARPQIARNILGEYPYQSHPAAYRLWMHLPSEWTSAEFAVEATRRGVSISPSGVFVVPPLEPPNAIRISVGAAEDQTQLKAGLEIIAQMLRDGKQCPSAHV